jgi:hypothetical protein
VKYSDKTVKEVVELIIEQDMAYAEISALSGVNIGTVQGWATALRQLQRQMLFNLYLLKLKMQKCFLETNFNKI